MRDLTPEEQQLLEYATDRQKEYLLGVAEYGSSRLAAPHLKTTYSSINRGLRVLRQKAAAIDPSLHAHKAPPGYALRGVSTLLDDDGQVRMTWVKTKQDHQAAMDALRDAVEEIVEPARGTIGPVPAPEFVSCEHLAVYPLGDAHVGMLAWAAEAGESWDLDIAERVICQTIDKVIALAPPAEQALLINLGDFYHVDNFSSKTPAHGNVLDADGRFPKIVRAGLRIKRYIIGRLLERHAHLRVWTLAGNHDESTSVMLALMLQAIYEREPRLDVSTNPARMQVLEFGENLISGMHGHTASEQQAAMYLAAAHREAWGRTSRRVIYRGHVHHDSKTKDHPGVEVETIRIIPPADAWHAGKMYYAARDQKCDVYHKRDGRVLRIAQPPQVDE